MAMQLSGNGGDDDGAVMSEINVTPLVDVVLVLLIIFMVTAPMLASTLDVKLPEVAAGKPAESTTVVITVAADGRIAVNGKLATREAAIQSAKSSGATSVIVRGDRDASYGTVIGFLDELRQAGITQAGLATQVVPESLPGGAGAGPR